MHFKKLHLAPVLAFAFALVFLIAGCSKDDVVELVGVCPIVLSTVPEDGDINVPLDQLITVTFTASVNPETINGQTIRVSNGSSSVTGTVTYSGTTATFTPSANLLPNTTYTGTVTTGVKDPMGNALQENYVWTFTTIPEVTLTASPEEGGTVTGAGTFAEETLVTVTAIPNDGFTFINWTEGEDVVSTSSSYQFEMNGNRNLVANFAEVVVGNFRINLSSSPAEGGTTTGSGQFTENSTVTVSAFPNPGYVFVNWTEGETPVSTSSSYQFVLTGNRTLVANYSLIPANQFAVILSANPAAGGSTSGSGSFAAATNVTVTATPNAGYSFVNWTANGTEVSTNPSYTFALEANRTLVANFAINTYSLNVSGTNGTVSKDPDQETYTHGTNVVLTATPNDGYEFTGWEGDASGNTSPLQVTMTSDKNIRAIFTAKASAFTLTVNTIGSGTVSKDPIGPTYPSGTIVTLRPTPDNGYEFTGWSGDETGSDTPLTVTMNSNKNITATFSPIPVTGGLCPNPAVDLGSAGNYAILAKSGISTTGTTSVTGNMGVSPITSTAITGFGLILSSDGTYSTSNLVTGRVYAADYTSPTPANLTTAVGNMETAFTTANGLAPDHTEYLAGNLNNVTLAAGVYKYGTGLLLSNTITLDGGGVDCAAFVFQIAGSLTVANNVKIILTNGAKADNIFWVVAGAGATIGTDVDFSGNILSKTLITAEARSKVNGRLLAQANVTLIGNTVVKPSN